VGGWTKDQGREIGGRADIGKVDGRRERVGMEGQVSGQRKSGRTEGQRRVRGKWRNRVEGQRENRQSENGRTVGDWTVGKQTDGWTVGMNGLREKRRAERKWMEEQREYG
jgi:hypothetical protein